MAERAGDGLGRAEDHVKEDNERGRRREREEEGGRERKKDQPVCEQVDGVLLSKVFFIAL